MDIKLRNIDANKILRPIAFILCVVLFICALAGGIFIALSPNYASFRDESGLNLSADELLNYESYWESTSFQGEFLDHLEKLQQLVAYYKSEDNINSGNTIDADRLETAIRDLFYSGYYSGDYNGYGSSSREVRVAQDNGSVYGDYDAPGVRERFKEDFADEIEQIKASMIRDDLRAFQDYQRLLREIPGFTYYAADGVNAVTNLEGITSASAVTADRFEQAKAHLIYENGTLKKVPASKTDRYSWSYDQHIKDLLDSENNDALRVYFSFDDSYLTQMEDAYANARSAAVMWLAFTVVCALLALIALIYLIAATGRKDESGNRRVYGIDRIFTELQLLIIGVLFLGGGFAFGSIVIDSIRYGRINIGTIYNNMSIGGMAYAGLGLLIGLGSAALGLCFILSVVRNIKARRFIKNSLIYMIVSSLWKGIRTFYYGGGIMKKVVLITLLICIVSATVIFAPVMFLLIVVFAPRWVRKYEEIKKGVEEVKNGNLSYKIDVTGEGEFADLARGINEISEASNIAIQNELKNQRLKTDLISNVSHDLKTPLTSIITYIDLLKQEGLDSPDAPKYLEILDQKSIRLQKLTEDLFDAAKASSGAIPVKFEKVDLLSLINQGLGEMGDRIDASNLEFKVSSQKDKHYVRADGQLLWRVVENLLSNVLKYAQEGSRVYIDLKEQNGKAGKIPNVILEIKNISKTELNIDADELMERFKRGDESRSTEGSGLGLAIAKDLVRLQNGWFEIKIDGDLFKAVVMLEAYTGE